MGNEYFEFTIRMGHVELLATGGFFGNNENSSFSPFLGSAIQDLPEAITEKFNSPFTTTIFINNSQQDYIRNKRILNQYYKADAMNDWGFQSERYHNQRFFPAHPLSFDSDNVIHTSVSFVMNSFATKVFDEKKTVELFTKTKKQEKEKVTEAGNLAKEYLAFLNKNKSSSFEILGEKKIKKDLIKMYNDTLGNALKTWNTNKVKVARKDYALQVINLFDLNEGEALSEEEESGDDEAEEE